MPNLTIDNLVKNGATANEDIDLNSLKYTSRLIVERAITRGWDIASFPIAGSILFIQIPGRNSLLRIFSASPSTMSYPAVKIAKNKNLTSSLLATANLPVIPEILMDASIIQTSNEAIAEFLNEHKMVVVKPLDASHGYGVTTDLVALEDVISSAEKALKYSILKKVLIQKQYNGQDIRILCINHKFANSITRIPARVWGNGTDTIEELILNENSSSRRGQNYKTKLNIIDVEKARQYLGSERIKEIPAKGEETRVVGVSNIGAGGERLNITENIPEWLKELAETASKVLELPVCGVDFLVKQLPNQTSTFEDIQPVVLEVNECSMMTMYDNLHSPEQFDVIDKYLDYLESIPEINKV